VRSHRLGAVMAAAVCLLAGSAPAAAATPQPFNPGYPTPGTPGTPTSWFPGGGASHSAAVPRTASGAAASAQPAAQSWFPWYDNASSGFGVDSIHLANPGTATVQGTISLPGATAITFNLGPGAQGHYSFPAGTRGGPVLVDAGGSGTVVASQRVTYLNSINEVPAQSLSEASNRAFFTWFDNASPGMTADNVHFVNPGPGSVNVSIQVGTLPPVSATIGGQGDAILTYPPGTRGGPVVVSSTGGSIITTQRVVFAQSFSEIPASVPPATAAPLYLNWYDTTSWGFTGDNVHVVNTGTTAADVTVSVAGQTHTLTGLGAGGGTYTSFPGVVAGPVVISSTQPLVASQRFLYHGELIEQSAAPAAAAVAMAWLPWYDNASAGVVDDVHVTNPDPAAAATINLFFPGRNPVTFTVDPGKDGYYGYPAGTIGGPVQIAVAAGGPNVLVAVRSFLWLPPPPPPPPLRHIVVSLSAQHLWAYQGNQLVLETDVTTGRPELPTPAGHYAIFAKYSPYEFISPWPYGSPYWYPSAWTNWAMEFIQGGYFLHDAPWRTWYGPGSNFGDGTHGCVNIPHDPMAFLYGWAQIGDVVDVVN